MRLQFPIRERDGNGLWLCPFCKQRLRPFEIYRIHRKYDDWWWCVPCNIRWVCWNYDTGLWDMLDAHGQPISEANCIDDRVRLLMDP